MSEPIALSGRWRVVMEAAGWRCECSGACGDPHAKGSGAGLAPTNKEGRCLHEHGAYASKHRGPVRLLAAPADPAMSPLAAARLAVPGLRAWCPACLDGARRAAARRARSQTPPGQGGLFDL